MKTDLKNIKKDLCSAFLKSLLTGKRTSLKQYKNDINKAMSTLLPSDIDPKELEKALTSKKKNHESAQTILSNARAKDQLATNPADYPQYDETIRYLSIAKELTRTLEIPKRSYTPRGNLSQCAQGALLLGVASTIIPFIGDITTSFNNASIAPYMASSIIGGMFGGIRMAHSNIKDYYFDQSRGLNKINQAFKP